MKKVLSYIFKDWKISDYIISGLALLVLFVPLIVSKCVDKPAEIEEIFSVSHAFCAMLLIWAVVFCSKNTIHGYVIGIGAIAFLSYFLFDMCLYGSFIAAMLMIAFCIFKLVCLCIKKDFDFEKFGLWDYVFLFGGLAFAAYPTYLIMWLSSADSLVPEILVVLSMMATLYLLFKKNKFAKLSSFCMTVLMAVSILLLVIYLKLQNVALVLGLVVVAIFFAIELIKALIPKKEKKKD